MRDANADVDSGANFTLKSLCWNLVVVGGATKRCNIRSKRCRDACVRNREAAASPIPSTARTSVLLKASMERESWRLWLNELPARDPDDGSRAGVSFAHGMPEQASTALRGGHMTPP